MNKLKAISKLVSDDKLRPSLQGVCIKDGKAYASNGFILGVISCDLPINGIIPANVADKGNTWTDSLVNTDEVVTLLDAKGNLVTGYKIIGNYPDVEKLIVDKAVKKPRHAVRLGLSTLEPLVKALKASADSKYDAPNILLEFPENSNEMITGTIGADSQIKLYIMPVSL